MKLTAKEFAALKLSEAIPVYIEEMYGAMKSGLAINMVSWLSLNRDGEVCSVCMGGAALAGLVGFSSERILSELTDEHAGGVVFKYDYPENKIRWTANALREASYREAIEQWYGGTSLLKSKIPIPWVYRMQEDHEMFSEKIDQGALAKEDIDQLAANLTEFSVLISQFDL